MLMDVVELKKVKKYKKIIMCPVCKKSWPYKRPSNFNLKLCIFFCKMKGTHLRGDIGNYFTF